MRPEPKAWRLSAAPLLALALALPAAAQDKPCAKAGESVDKVLTWTALRIAVKDYGHCDKGETKEIFTDALMRVAVGGWPKVAELGPLWEDAAFRGWIVKRLEDPASPKGDIDDLNDLAGASCPKGMLKVCEQLQVAINKGREAAAPKKSAPAPAPAPAAPAKPAT